MSKFDKLLQRIMSLDNNMRFNELCKIMEAYGYTLTAPSSGSSHRTFRKPGRMPVTIPQHEPIKKAYIIMVRNIVEQEERQGENDEEE